MNGPGPFFETLFRPMHLRPFAAQLDGIDVNFLRN